jgi:hypothetical protein
MGACDPVRVGFDYQEKLSGDRNRAWLSENSIDSVQLHDSIDSLPHVDAAIVATASERHCVDTQQLLKRGVHVLVEKPLALRTEDAAANIALATNTGLALGVNLLTNDLAIWDVLNDLLSEKWTAGDPVRRISIQWCDPSGEVRHGEVKREAAMTSMANDLMPHLWTILIRLGIKHPENLPLLARYTPALTTVVHPANEPQSGHSNQNCEVALNVSRRSRVRRRRIHVQTDRHAITANFSIEPGYVIFDGVRHAVPELAMRPLERSLRRFLSVAAADDLPTAIASWPYSAIDCLGSVTYASNVHEKLTTSQDEYLKDARSDLADAVIDRFAGEDEGLRQTIRDAGNRSASQVAIEWWKSRSSSDQSAE